MRGGQEHAACADTDGSFECTCEATYVDRGVGAEAGRGTVCDLDECASGQDNCDVSDASTSWYTWNDGHISEDDQDLMGIRDGRSGGCDHMQTLNYHHLRLE